ncbi:ATP synthase F1 subunit delta [bacterium]|jgi:F-type H+-transporting ATPase subunit delta|nr:ATP synthase F1 subunit delta [bacterium]
MSDVAAVLPEEMPLALVYAEAVWNLAERDNVLDELIAEYDEFIADVLDPNPTVEQLFKTITINRESRRQVLEKSFRGTMSDLLLNFLMTLNRHDRLGLARACGQALHELADRRRGVVPVEVRSALPLTEEQERDVENVIRQRFGVEPRLHTKIDKSLLGGLWIRVGDTVLDRTLKTNLRKLRDVIRTRNSYEIQSGRSYFDSPSGN